MLSHLNLIRGVFHLSVPRFVTFEARAVPDHGVKLRPVAGWRRRTVHLFEPPLKSLSAEETLRYAEAVASGLEGVITVLQLATSTYGDDAIFKITSTAPDVFQGLYGL